MFDHVFLVASFIRTIYHLGTCQIGASGDVEEISNFIKKMILSFHAAYVLPQHHNPVGPGALFGFVFEFGHIFIIQVEVLKASLPNARRAVMYTPMDLAAKSIREIESDVERIARDLGPCDVVFADIEAGTPDERGWDVIRLCKRITEERESAT